MNNSFHLLHLTRVLCNRLIGAILGKGKGSGSRAVIEMKQECDTGLMSRKIKRGGLDKKSLKLWYRFEKNLASPPGNSRAKILHQKCLMLGINVQVLLFPPWLVTGWSCPERAWPYIKHWRVHWQWMLLVYWLYSLQQHSLPSLPLLLSVFSLAHLSVLHIYNYVI